MRVDEFLYTGENPIPAPFANGAKGCGTRKFSRECGAILHAMLRTVVVLSHRGKRQTFLMRRIRTGRTDAPPADSKIRELITYARSWRNQIKRKLFRLEQPNAVTFACPKCGEGIPNFNVVIHFGEDWTTIPFRCSRCRTLLCVPSSYRWSLLIWCTVLAFVIPWLLGISPWYYWLGATVLSWCLLGFATSVYVKIFFSPPIVVYDGPDLLEDPNDLPLNPWRK